MINFKLSAIAKANNLSYTCTEYTDKMVFNLDQIEITQYLEYRSKPTELIFLTVAKSYATKSIQFMDTYKDIKEFIKNERK